MDAHGRCPPTPVPGLTAVGASQGHEYVELKNTAAAVEAYRHAVDMNPRDYRAWYGLGQTYEILKMPLYSLYYYQKAAQLRPSDARMWCERATREGACTEGAMPCRCAVANCHESLGQREDAVRCYRRAENLGDSEGIALSKLATLTAALGEEVPAATMTITMTMTLGRGRR